MGGLEVALLYIAGVMALGFGVSVIWHNSKSIPAWTFFAVTVGVAFWAFGIAAFLSTDNISAAWYDLRVYYIAAMLIAIATYLNSLALTASRRFVGSLIFSSIVFVVAALAIWSSPTLIISNLVTNGAVKLADINPIGYTVYMLVFSIYFLGALVTMYYLSLHGRTVDIAKQTRAVMYAYLIPGSIGALFNLILPVFGLYQYIWVGPLAIFIFIPFVYYTIINHDLYDVRESVARSIAYITTLITLAAIYTILALGVSLMLLGPASTLAARLTSPVNIALTLALIYLFQPIKNYFDVITNRIFYRARYNEDELMHQLNAVYTSNIEPVPMLNHFSDTLSGAMKASFITYIIRGGHDRIVGSGGNSDAPLYDGLINDLLACESCQSSGVFSVEQLVQDSYSRTQIGRVARKLQKNKVAILMILQNKLGFILLGEHMSSGYIKRDMRFLDNVCSEVSIALQNTLSIEEVHRLNKSLQERIEYATRKLRNSNKQLQELDETKDEFISMASHQLRTPLTSIKGYISMVLEGDAGKITDRQRALLNESFASSERMVHLISDFLNVSRLQTGKFMIDASPTNLADVVAGEVASIQRMAEGRDINIEFRKPKVFPVLNIDENKLRQVMMNLIDNAIYYSPMGSTIEVKLVRYDGEVRFEVHDQGMGVPLDVQHRLFTKFFRADNARKQRPDGTGIGLYLAKKVITEQGGDIIFSSKPGKGSVFGFRLPIAPLRIK